MAAASVNPGPRQLCLEIVAAARGNDSSTELVSTGHLDKISRGSTRGFTPQHSFRVARENLRCFAYQF